MKMQKTDIGKIVKILKKEVERWQQPVVTEYAKRTKNPFFVLISCVLSLRTKDETTRDASYRLFNVSDNPDDMVKLTEDTIQKLIYPVGFYKVKAGNILSICNDLKIKHNSKVPDDMEGLLRLKGVGRKTANLVLTHGFRKLGICVDIHVHRISNRFGYVHTKTPDETEFALRKILPKKYWIIYNDLLVTFGQNLCKPVSPFCSDCKIYEYCNRVGVKKSR